MIRFATTLLAYRIAEMDRWHARHGGWKQEGEAAAEVYRTRTAIWEAFNELELSTDSKELMDLARHSLDHAYSIRQAESHEEIYHRADQVREALTQVIRVARTSGQGRHVAIPDDMLLPVRSQD
jgi:hypothetical protein